MAELRRNVNPRRAELEAKLGTADCPLLWWMSHPSRTPEELAPFQGASYDAVVSELLDRLASEEERR